MGDHADIRIQTKAGRKIVKGLSQALKIVIKWSGEKCFKNASFGEKFYSTVHTFLGKLEIVCTFGEKNAPIGEKFLGFHRAETQYSCGFAGFLVKR